LLLQSIDLLFLTVAVLLEFLDQICLTVGLLLQSLDLICLTVAVPLQLLDLICLTAAVPPELLERFPIALDDSMAIAQKGIPTNLASGDRLCAFPSTADCGLHM
jgi:hypothetical protein